VRAEKDYTSLFHNPLRPINEDEDTRLVSFASSRSSTSTFLQLPFAMPPKLAMPPAMAPMAAGGSRSEPKPILRASKVRCPPLIGRTRTFSNTAFSRSGLMKDGWQWVRRVLWGRCAAQNSVGDSQTLSRERRASLLIPPLRGIAKEGTMREHSRVLLRLLYASAAPIVSFRQLFATNGLSS
jgi:hypothetical protein